MSFKKIEDIQYLYENLNSHEEELVELLEVLEDHLMESGYSDRAIECFIETADVHDVESHIQLCSLDEGKKLQLLKKLGTGAWNIIKKQGRKLKTAAKRNTPVSTRKGIKDTVNKTKDSVTKTGDKVKNAIKNNPKKSAIAGAGALTVGALATGGDPKDKEDEKISKQVDAYVAKNKGDQPIRKVDSAPYNPPNKQEKSATPEKKKVNKPDGLARIIAGTADAITGNMTDFDQRGGKPQGLSRVMGGVTDFATQGLTDLDKRGGKPWGMGRVVAGAADKLTGDRFDFDKRGVSKLNKGQQKIYEPKKDEAPKVDNNPLSWKNMPDTLDKLGKNAPAPPKPSEPKKDKPPEPPKPTNPSGKVLPTPKAVRPGSARERMISKNIEIHGADKITKLRNKNAAFQATKDKTSGYSKDDFIKDFPNSNTAKKYREKNRIKHPDLNKVLGRKESYDPTVQEQNEEVDAFDIILSYLKETQQADSLDEALYVMTEMDAQTIQGIVGDFKKKNLAEEEADRVKDRRLEKYGIGHDGSDRNAGSSSSSSSGNRPKGKTVLQKETEKKYGKGKSAVDIVRAKIKAKHGSGAIAPSKTTQKATTKAQKSADQDGDGKVRTVDA